MTVEIDLDQLIGSAMDSGILHGLIPAETAALMRARLAGMLKAPHCLLCAVRAMTEGTPTIWWPKEPTSVKGAVLRTGHVAHGYGYVGETAPFADLWLGDGTMRVRIIGLGMTLRNALEKAAPQVGDMLAVTYTGQGTIEHGKHRGRAYKMHEVSVERGHH